MGDIIVLIDAENIQAKLLGNFIVCKYFLVEETGHLKSFDRFNHNNNYYQLKNKSQNLYIGSIPAMLCVISSF